MISSIEIPEDVAAKEGLRGAQLRGLGRLVVLAGPNGGGKSRYLRAVATAVELAATGPPPDGSWLAGLAPGGPERLAKELAMHRAKMPKVEIDGKQLSRKPKVIVLHNPTDVSSMPDADDVPPSTLKGRVSSSTSGGLASGFEAAPAYLNHIAQLKWDLQHPGLVGPWQALAFVETGTFDRITSRFLQSFVTPRHSGERLETFLGSRKFNQIELSPGQKLLLSWAVVLQRQREWLNDAIVIIDEPEVHLHPDACVRLFDALLQILGSQGQIWTATHSVPLIAYAGMDSVFLVRDAVIEYASQKLDLVVESLLGGEDGRHRLRTFLGDAHEVGAARYLAECLAEPGVCGPRAGDPQAGQLDALVNEVRRIKGRVRVLDYGAGRGRLAAALRLGFRRFLAC